MAGIYVHVPFCKRACHYCNFHFSVSLKNKNDFIAALLKEISLQQNYLQQEAVDTIYFGGGTPSLLLPQELTAIMHALRANFSISHHAEITLEANPDDINSTQLMAWRQAG
ncbi:MAG TPA: radical SAM protein, partial [Chitinophagaceae bacterium]|nr:radical SAM protein [Chitinophagaceae bacterium]